MTVVGAIHEKRRGASAESPAVVVVFDDPGVRPVYAFPPMAVLDPVHVGLMLGVSAETADNLPLRWSPLGNGKQKFRRRVLAKYVYEYLEDIAK